jgi:hypothetical protein
VAQKQEGRFSLKTFAEIGGIVSAIIALLLFFGIKLSSSGPPRPRASPTPAGKTRSVGPTTPTPSNPPAAAPEWTSSSTNPILIGPQSGIDFDSIPPGPGSGSNTLILYAGNELYSSGSIKIATWTKNFKPTRGNCNVLAQAQGNFEQPAEPGGEYCLLTGQGHTVYLKITRIDTSNTADVTAYANVKVWRTSG